MRCQEVDHPDRRIHPHQVRRAEPVGQHPPARADHLQGGQHHLPVEAGIAVPDDLVAAGPGLAGDQAHDALVGLLKRHHLRASGLGELSHEQRYPLTHPARIAVLGAPHPVQDVLADKAHGGDLPLRGRFLPSAHCGLRLFDSLLPSIRFPGLRLPSIRFRGPRLPGLRLPSLRLRGLRLPGLRLPNGGLAAGSSGASSTLAGASLSASLAASPPTSSTTGDSGSAGASSTGGSGSLAGPSDPHPDATRTRTAATAACRRHRRQLGAPGRMRPSAGRDGPKSAPSATATASNRRT